MPRNPDDATLLFMPLFHSAMLNGTFEAMMRGLRYVQMSKFTFRGMLQAVEKYKVNTALTQSRSTKVIQSKYTVP